jgi:prophage maintenance system killer protein
MQIDKPFKECNMSGFLTTNGLYITTDSQAIRLKLENVNAQWTINMILEEMDARDYHGVADANKRWAAF